MTNTETETQGAGASEKKFTILTWKGYTIDLEKGPIGEQVDIEDVAHHLSMQCRFVGAVNRFYSIAEHSIYAAMLAPRMYAPYFLLHDAHEYIYHDLTSPLKKLLFQNNSIYKTLCDQCDKNLITGFNLNYTGFVNLKHDIKEVDVFLLALEQKYLFGRYAPSPVLPSDHPLYGMPFGMTQDEAKQNFIQYFTDATA